MEVEVVVNKVWGSPLAQIANKKGGHRLVSAVSGRDFLLVSFAITGVPEWEGIGGLMQTDDIRILCKRSARQRRL